MSNFGVKVSNKGQDVLSSKKDETLFSSENTTLPIYKEIPFKITIAKDTQTKTYDVPHNLPYIPLALGWTEDEGGSIKYFIPSRTTSFYTFIYSFTDRIRIYITSQAPGWFADKDYVFNGYLYIFRMGI